MDIVRIDSDKKRFLPLLLLADEQEDMIYRYLEDGVLFVLFDGETPLAVSVTVQLSEGVYELKNLAVSPDAQKRGLGRAMIEHALHHLRGRGQTLLVGTGDVPSTRGFYEACGFSYSHRVKDFFTKNYDHPIVEDGVLLTDMIYLRRDIEP